jgi:amino acid transporter
MVTASRIVFALGRDGLLPSWTARTSQYNTPIFGNLAVVFVSIGLLIWAGVTTYGDKVKPPLANPIQAFFITTAAGSYLVELVYVFLAFFALKLVWDSRAEGGTWWKLIAVLLGLATPVLAFKGSLDPFPTFPNNRGVFFAVACIVISAVWYGIVQVTRPRAVANAARHAVEHHGVAALDEPLAGGQGAAPDVAPS